MILNKVFLQKLKVTSKLKFKHFMNNIGKCSIGKFLESMLTLVTDSPECAYGQFKKIKSSYLRLFSI